MKMKYVFPAVIERNKINGEYIVIFPDLPDILEHGKTLEDALSDAKTALEVHLFYKEKYNEQIPEASDILSLAKPEGAAAAPVEADMFRIRQRLDSKSVSKAVTLPKWLRDLGEEYNINFSQILREALRLELGIYGYFWE
jgi:predicted RNase H-like HicB family nuclease